MANPEYRSLRNIPQHSHHIREKLIDTWFGHVGTAFLLNVALVGKPSDMTSQSVYVAVLKDVYEHDTLIISRDKYVSDSWSRP